MILKGLAEHQPRQWAPLDPNRRHCCPSSKGEDHHITCVRRAFLVNDKGQRIDKEMCEKRLIANATPQEVKAVEESKKPEVSRVKQFDLERAYRDLSTPRITNKGFIHRIERFSYYPDTHYSHQLWWSGRTFALYELRFSFSLEIHRHYGTLALHSDYGDEIVRTSPFMLDALGGLRFAEKPWLISRESAPFLEVHGLIPVRERNPQGNLNSMFEVAVGVVYLELE